MSQPSKAPSEARSASVSVTRSIDEVFESRICAQTDSQADGFAHALASKDSVWISPPGVRPPVYAWPGATTSMRLRPCSARAAYGTMKCYLRELLYTRVPIRLTTWWTFYFSEGQYQGDAKTIHPLADCFTLPRGMPGHLSHSVSRDRELFSRFGVGLSESYCCLCQGGSTYLQLDKVYLAY